MQYHGRRPGNQTSQKIQISGKYYYRRCKMQERHHQENPYSKKQFQYLERNIDELKNQPENDDQSNQNICLVINVIWCRIVDQKDMEAKINAAECGSTGECSKSLGHSA